MDTGLRDNLLVTAGTRAGYMHMMNSIELPHGVNGEEKIAKFIAEAVDDWLCFHSDTCFDEYIETELLIKYGNQFHKEMMLSGSSNDCKQ